MSLTRGKSRRLGGIEQSDRSYYNLKCWEHQLTQAVRNIANENGNTGKEKQFVDRSQVKVRMSRSSFPHHVIRLFICVKPTFPVRLFSLGLFIQHAANSTIGELLGNAINIGCWSPPHPNEYGIL